MLRVKDHVQYFAKLRTFPSSFVMFVAATLFCSHIHEMVGRNLVLCLKRAENLIFLLERCGFNFGVLLQLGEKQRNVRACVPCASLPYRACTEAFHGPLYCIICTQ